MKPAADRRPSNGLLAEFESPEALLAAARRAHRTGYRRLEAYTPLPVEGLPKALGHPPTRLPFFVLGGGILGGAGAYFMMWYSAVVDYPLEVGGKPLHSWPSFIPITFELTVLGAAITALLAMLWLNGLPRPHHPVFAVPGFERASHDRFFLAIEAEDSRFDEEKTRAFLLEAGAVNVEPVEKTS